ncbi:MAG: hypothetical protein H8F28_25975 [Fibrella sp.]|nr:hypothetical protein [Armatimonadota bacterium]
MAMPKKGSRSIVVDDVLYRWRTRGEREYNMTVAVEPVTDGGMSSLIVDTSVMAPTNSPPDDKDGKWFGAYTISVTPAVVEAYIRQAMNKGWKPTEKGKPFILVADKSMATGKT